MEARTASRLGCPLLWLLVPWSIHTGQGSSLGPQRQARWDRAGSTRPRPPWARTNRPPVSFFPSASAASCPGTVFSVEGAPENRAGKSSVAARLPCPLLGSRDPLSRTLRAVCSPTDPFDQGVVATDEVKEEPPEPFQKIGPSMRATLWGWGCGAGRWVRGG